jgi:hypothetical protein
LKNVKPRRRNLQEASILKTSLLITNLNKRIHKRDTRVMSKELSTKRIKLITKPKSKSHRCVEAQGKPSDPCMIDRWQ